MKWYAAKIRELTFEELGEDLIDIPDAYEICRVTEGTQAHKMKPVPIGWGYFDSKKEAKAAVKANRFPSYK